MRATRSVGERSQYVIAIEIQGPPQLRGRITPAPRESGMAGTCARSANAPPPKGRGNANSKIQSLLTQRHIEYFFNTFSAIL